MTWKKKGNRIRASDKSLVYHFCIGWLLLLFVEVFLCVALQIVSTFLDFFTDCSIFILYMNLTATVPLKDYDYNAEVELVNPVADTVANAENFNTPKVFSLSMTIPFANLII